MKKCYILREKLLVDLYKNDEFSLEKSLHEELKWTIRKKAGNLLAKKK